MSDIEALWSGDKAAPIRDKFRQASDGLETLEGLRCSHCGTELPVVTCVKCPACGQPECEE